MDKHWLKMHNAFSDKTLVKGLLEELRRLVENRPMRLMEVCGTHTMAIFQSGLRSLLPEGLVLLSGPGCPVCVTPQEYIDMALRISAKEDVIILTFGDMLRVPGSATTLEKQRAQGSDIRIAYSPFQALEVAQANPEKKVIFLAVGFETTAPSIALSILEAKRMGLKNIFVLLSLRRIVPAMAFLTQGGPNLDGFLCPGHVSAIIGTKPYEPLARDYGKPCVIAGFEPLDILQGLLMLARQVKEGRHEVENQYHRVVKDSGNPKAMEAIDEVMEVRDIAWRGLGLIISSGFGLKEAYRAMDCQHVFPGIESPQGSTEPSGCECGSILKGNKSPEDCPLFGRACTPQSPLGPCMVSQEGTCAAYFHYTFGGSAPKPLLGGTSSPQTPEFCQP